MRARLRRPGTFWLKWGAAIATLTTACASSAPDPAPTPTRSVIRVEGSMPVEIFTDPGVATRTISQARGDVWASLPAVFETLGIPLAEVDPGGLELGNSAFQTRRIEGQGLGRFIDCGSGVGGPLVNRYRVTVSIRTRAVDAPDGGTLLTTTVEAHGEPQSVGGGRIPCRSRGTLELRVAQLVVERLGGM